ncbi:Uncharacterised protein [Mycobacteroides abscessus subsp. abscessus]|nr:Uncharacterised protein [Mycobacteroides abscessus subsp. abscessus]
MMNKKEVSPILPMNISMMITHFPTADRSGVIPIDNPVVPKAEHTSKIIAVTLWASVRLSTITAKKHMPTAKMVMTRDFNTSS